MKSLTSTSSIFFCCGFVTFAWDYATAKNSQSGFFGFEIWKNHYFFVVVFLATCRQVKIFIWRLVCLVFMCYLFKNLFILDAEATAGTRCFLETFIIVQSFDHKFLGSVIFWDRLWFIGGSGLLIVIKAFTSFYYSIP